MKTVNLLPTWYLQQQKQRRHLRVHVAVMALLAAGMVAAQAGAKQHLASLESTRDKLAGRVADVGDPAKPLQAEQTRLKRLEDLQLAYRELGNTIPMSAVIQQIQNAMNVGMALSRTSIDVRAEPVKGSGFVGDPKNPPRMHDVARIVVVGVAPNDVQIAQLIGKISQNPLFSNVALNYTRTEILNEHSIRRFEIQMEMELDRLTTEDPGGMKSADACMPEGGPHAG